MAERMPDYPTEYDEDPIADAAKEIADKIIDELGFPASETNNRATYLTRARMIAIAYDTQVALVISCLEAWDLEQGTL